jgi:hypothetical protein
MKNIVILVLLLSFTNLYSQDVKETGYYYCVQVMSTENPELLRPGMFVGDFEQAMVEVSVVNGRRYHRIMFVYSSIKEQDEALKLWKKEYKDSIRITRTESQIQKMYRLFSHD